MPGIGSGLKEALIGPFHTSVKLIPEDLGCGLVLINSTSLLFIGSDYTTEDFDITVSPLTLHAFFANAIKTLDFKKSNSDMGILRE